MANIVQIDEAYEFSAPRFFDFLNKETREQISEAERWFETSLSYAPSPFMPKVRMERSVHIDGLCNFDEVEKTQKKAEAVKAADHGAEQEQKASDGEQQMVVNMEITDGSSELPPKANTCETNGVPQEEKSSSTAASGKCDSTSFAFPALDVALSPEAEVSYLKASETLEACTLKAERSPVKETVAQTSSKNQTAKQMSNLIKQPSSNLKPNNYTHSQPTRFIKPEKCAIKCLEMGTKSTISTDTFQENQAIKKQKLDVGRSRKIQGKELISLGVEGVHEQRKKAVPRTSTIGMVKKFKSKTIEIELPKENQAIKKQKLDGGRSRKIGVNELIPLGVKGFHEQHKEATLNISIAQMAKKFQTKTREIELQNNSAFSQDSISSLVQRRPKRPLTRPKELELQTAQRVRAVRIKSSAELEEEMLAKMPKFKARPLNKKILEAPSFPAPQRSIPQPPHVHEFQLKTMERANQRTDSAAAVSSDASYVNQIKPSKLTEPRPPVLETALRARPTKIKSSQELEVEELEKIPKFKAIPLNKKIFESKGKFGLSCHSKPQITTPQEFHFATNDRLGPPPSTVVDLFDKLSLHSESSRHSKQDHHPRITKPNPFHLHTEERGTVKEKLFTLHFLQKHIEEERARIPKANPYPYTTDYPVMPPKPLPKQCTKPELFQLESLIRHEQEVQKKKDEMERMKREDAKRINFRGQPVRKDDPIPLPDRERKPLTEVQEFVLHVDHRAVERSEFNQMIKVKELVSKRIREDHEHAKIEEEKEVKQMRRTMVPHARPIPKFDNPFHPHKSTKENTRPRSPKLLVKESGRKHALHMR